ncbi:hypothetical protein MKI84_06460 [Ancylobacter sp. A5.8]|uniref:hypothetical protein n=1 Tax=Ancylobacter gelatini TaxID=2919920 RepID=UPI001F4E4155|nr:hypothetical protein [Ancylobacter gelatini]MCJ8142555.1 hypothetical protein [Ancylobacter gelatini]
MTAFDSHAAGEPRLAEILADPLVALVLKRDRLDLDDVARTLAREQRRLQRAARRPGTLHLAA